MPCVTGKSGPTDHSSHGSNLSICISDAYSKPKKTMTPLPMLMQTLVSSRKAMSTKHTKGTKKCRSELLWTGICVRAKIFFMQGTGMGFLACTIDICGKCHKNYYTPYFHINLAYRESGSCFSCVSWTMRASVNKRCVLTAFNRPATRPESSRGT